MLEGEREILSYEGTQGRVLEPLAAQAIGSLLEEPVRTRGLVVWRRHRWQRDSRERVLRERASQRASDARGTERQGTRFFPLRRGSRFPSSGRRVSSRAVGLEECEEKVTRPKH